jgi:hypothetical protein
MNSNGLKDVERTLPPNFVNLTGIDRWCYNDSQRSHTQIQKRFGQLGHGLYLELSPLFRSQLHFTRRFDDCQERH